MRHHKVNRKFGRERNQRKALLKSLARSVILYGKIKTTEAKAKEIRPYVEKLITLAKKNTLASQRLIISRLQAKDASLRLFKTVAPKYMDRNGGYARVIKMAPRKSDGSKMAVVELV